MKKRTKSKPEGFDALVWERMQKSLQGEKKGKGPIRLKTLEALWGRIEKEVAREFRKAFHLDPRTEGGDKPRRRRERPFRPRTRRGRFNIQGRIVDQKSDIGLPGLLVRATVAALRTGEPLGEAKTDPNGHFVISLERAFVEDMMDSGDQLALSVCGGEDEVIHQETIPFKPGATRFLPVQIAVQFVETMLERASSSQAARRRRAGRKRVIPKKTAKRKATRKKASKRKTTEKKTKGKKATGKKRTVKKPGKKKGARHGGAARKVKTKQRGAKKTTGKGAVKRKGAANPEGTNGASGRKRAKRAAGRRRS